MPSDTINTEVLPPPQEGFDFGNAVHKEALRTVIRELKIPTDVCSRHLTELISKLKGVGMDKLKQETQRFFEV
jgi:hypothetical protein